MIEVVLPANVAVKLRRELRRAGDSEIGGVLAGEDLGGGRFLVADLSVPGGTRSAAARMWCRRAWRAKRAGRFLHPRCRSSGSRERG